MRGGNSLLKRAKSAIKQYHQKEFLLENLNSEYSKVKKLRQTNSLLKSKLSQVLEQRNKKECFVQEVQQYISKWIKLSHPVTMPLKNLIIKIKAQIQRVNGEIKQLEQQLRKGLLQENDKLELRRHIVSLCEELTASLAIQQQRINPHLQRAQSFILEEEIESLSIVKEAKAQELNQLLRSYKNLKIQLELDSKELYTTLKACQSQEVNRPDQENTESNQQINKEKLAEKEKLLSELRQQLFNLKNQKSLMKRTEEQHFKELQAELQENIKIRDKLNSIIKPRVQPPIKQITLTGNNLLIQEKKIKKILPVVQNLELRHIAEFLSLKAHCSRIEFDKFYQALTKGYSKSMTIQNLSLRLRQQPFQLREEEALLLSRYLVQDNRLKKVSLEMEQSAPIAVIRSIFQKVIGKIKIYSKQEIESTWKQIKAEPRPVLLQPQEQAARPPQGPARPPREPDGVQPGAAAGVLHAGGGGERGRELVQGEGLRGHPQRQFLVELRSQMVIKFKCNNKIQTPWNGSSVAREHTSPSQRRTALRSLGSSSRRGTATRKPKGSSFSTRLPCITGTSPRLKPQRQVQKNCRKFRSKSQVLKNFSGTSNQRCCRCQGLVVSSWREWCCRVSRRECVVLDERCSRRRRKRAPT